MPPSVETKGIQGRPPGRPLPPSSRRPRPHRAPACRLVPRPWQPVSRIVETRTPTIETPTVETPTVATRILTIPSVHRTPDRRNPRENRWKYFRLDPPRDDAIFMRGRDDPGRRCRAEVATAKAAWTAAAAVAKQQRKYHAPFKHDRGLWVGPEGMEGRGATFVNQVRSAPARVCLDHAFLADALAAVELFSPSGTAVVQAADALSAVAIGKGIEAGERVVAVMMPLAID